MNDSKKIKILHLQTKLNLACGVTRTISQIIKNTSQDFEHHLIALEGDGLKRFSDFGFNPVVLRIKKKSFNGTIKIFLALAIYCKNNSIQIIHSHHRYFDTITWLLQLFYPMRTITSVHSKVFGRKIFSYKADILIACSNSIREHLIKNFKVSQNKIKVIHNSTEPVDLNILRSKKEILAELNIPNGIIIIGFIGRINFSEKGVDILLDAFKQLCQIRQTLYLLMIGNGQNEDDVRVYFRKYNLNALLLPPKTDVNEYLNVMDIFILPSRVDPFPLTMLEAGLMKIPFVGSKVDGISELIEQEKDGLLFESGDIDELTKQIIRLLDDDKLRYGLSQNLYQKIINSFTTDKIIPQYFKLYSDVIKSD